MRNRIAGSMVMLLPLLAASSAVMAQQAQGPRIPPDYVAEGVRKMPNPPGPAPAHDLTGAWVGPQKSVLGPFPAMTTAGEAAFKLNKPIPAVGADQVKLAAANDPFMVCDPLGFPRDLLNHAVSSRGGMWFEPVANRMLILFEQQRVWREVWMDGRELPKKVDAKGAPDSRYYGYSVGHWDGDNTFVIDSTGLDGRTWLDESGHPHSVDAHIQERYTRRDQYNVELTVTIDDPKFYTKPFQFLKANYYWMKDQDFEENLCVPSEGIAYRESMAKPAGWGSGGEPAKHK